MNWTSDMYRYLSWLLFERVFGMCEWTREEETKFKPLIKEIGNKLTRKQALIVINRARRISDEYEDSLLHSMGKMYWKELNSNDGYIPRHITYDAEIYDIWLSAIRKKKTVKIKYDSTTSGFSERLVDPYLTKSPYGIGYCHRRKEIRQFRFDRIIDIKLMNKIFKKPKGWKEQWEESRRRKDSDLARGS
jgi:hypothetical protein